MLNIIKRHRETVLFRKSKISFSCGVSRRLHGYDDV